MGVDRVNAQGLEQLEERTAEVEELQGHGKLKGVGGSGTKGKVEIDILQEAGQQLRAGRGLPKVVADGLHIRARALLLVVEDDRQDRGALVNTVKPRQQVQSSYCQQRPGVGTVEQAAGQGALGIPLATSRGLVVEEAAPGAVLPLEFEKFMADRGGCGGQRLEGQLAEVDRDQMVKAQPARAHKLQITAVQGRTALAAAGSTALASRRAAQGSRSSVSPRRSMPGTITLVKMPSRGMMQSPTCLKMAQPW